MFPKLSASSDVIDRKGYKQRPSKDMYRLLFGASNGPVNVEMLLKGTLAHR